MPCEMSEMPCITLWGSPPADIFMTWGPLYSLCSRWCGRFSSEFVKSDCIRGQLGYYLTMWEAQGQVLAQRVGNVMICGLGITECLLAASGGNVLERGADHSEPRARRTPSFQQLPAPSHTDWLPEPQEIEEKASCSIEKECLSPPKTVQRAETEFLQLLGPSEVCICVGFIPWAHPHLPALVTILEWLTLPLELVT